MRLMCLMQNHLRIRSRKLATRSRKFSTYFDTLTPQPTTPHKMRPCRAPIRSTPTKKSGHPESNQGPSDSCDLYSQMLYQLSYSRLACTNSNMAGNLPCLETMEPTFRGVSVGCKHGTCGAQLVLLSLLFAATVPFLQLLPTHPASRTR